MTASANQANRFTTGARYIWRGFKLIHEPKIRLFVIVPLLINIVLFSLGIICFAIGVDYVLDKLLPDWLYWLRFLLWPIFALASLVIVFYGFSILANLAASPFNGLLAAAVERHLTGQTDEVPFSWAALGRDVLRTIGAELRKLAYFLLWAFPCLLLFIIPGVNLIAAPLWFLFGAWMMAVEYVDCPLGNHGRPFPAVKQLLSQRRNLALGFGSTVMAMTMIPIVNFFAMPVGVAAATALYLDELAPELDH
jgi:CysZ protein